MRSEWHPAGVHRFEEGVLVLIFLSTDLKKTQQVENFNSTMIFTAVSLKFYWKNVDVGSPSKKLYPGRVTAL